MAKGAPFVDCADARAKLVVAASRLTEAQERLDEVLNDPRLREALQDHEVMNLQDTRRKVAAERDWLDETIHDIRTRLSKRKTVVR
jgi:hypothetical protein